MSDANKTSKYCLECGRWFVPKMRKSVCCSPECRGIYYRKTHREDERRRARDWRLNNPEKYALLNHAEPPRYGTCKNCDAVFRIRTTGKFCSISCRGKYRRKTQPEWYRAAYLRDKPRSNALSRKRYHATRQKAPWEILLTAAKVRAKKRGLPFDLTYEWAKARWTGCCEVSGLPFEQPAKRSPFSASIDQIEAKIGYTQNNCRFVLWGINSMKGIGSYEDVFKISAAISSARKGSLLYRVEPS